MSRVKVVEFTSGICTTTWGNEPEHQTWEWWDDTDWYYDRVEQRGNVLIYRNGHDEVLYAHTAWVQYEDDEP